MYSISTKIIIRSKNTMNNKFIDITKVLEANKPNTKRYTNEKIHILHEMCISMTDDEQAYMHSLATTVAVDNYARKLIMDRL
jgi:hypothetical protein